ncbi:LUD domain-containing protein [Pontibacter sp. 172403-2]|uniref:LutC/YkgG family protein n=1 Tax=Pontibacter rufus TaxID=2791028 RepID=UPI0018AFEEB1|nr:LUD domain-containing protein [Pontibacter sp. 172403-2]MBF9255093.1 LUD domain-containing protein [Pontibacter sp. 172403-2]
MSSREKILQQVKANKPPMSPLPTQTTFASIPPEERLTAFIKSNENAGGIVCLVPDVAIIGNYLKVNFTSPERILNTVQGVGFGLEADAPITDGRAFGNLEIAVVESLLGVAENGAAWVTEDNLPTRVLPFICEHLALVIHADNIVGTMHEAYAALNVAATGYGTFIAGPSRTADIEQSLVIGAHGPKRMHVFIVQPF